MASWRLIAASTLRPTPWRNGLGTTRDIATHHAPDGTLRWQVGIADLQQDAPFSHYPHCDRIFTPIAGDPPPELAFHGGPFEPCPVLVPKPFSGEWPTLSRIPAPGRAFNLVYDRRHHTGQVSIHTLPAHAALPIPPAAEILVHCLTGQLEVADLPLAAGDTAHGGAPAPCTATADSVAILVTIHPAP